MKSNSVALRFLNQQLAATIGLEIDSIRTIGGTYLGSSELTYQYVIKSADQQKVDLFAALMGDLSFEYQDAVIAANYTNNDAEATAIELTYQAPANTTIESIEQMLKEVGIDGSSFSFETGELSITAFSEDEVKDVINKLKNTGYEFKQRQQQNSRYLDNAARQDLYRQFLVQQGEHRQASEGTRNQSSSQVGQQNRQLDNACSKALAICEAAARFPEENQESERLKVAQQAAQQWDNIHQRQQQTGQRIAKSSSVEEVAEVKPQPQVVTQEDTNNVYKVPEVLSIK